MDGLTKNRRLVTKYDSAAAAPAAVVAAAAAPFLFFLAVVGRSEGRREGGREGGTVDGTAAAAAAGTDKIKVESRSLASPSPWPPLRHCLCPCRPRHAACPDPDEVSN